MLYEMIAVVRPGNLAEVKEIARTAGTLILASGGVVRGITNWGPFLLTKRVKKHQMKHDSGHHFIMRFDASPATQRLVYKTVAIDPRMLRTGMVRIGERLDEIKDVKGVVEWTAERERTGLGRGDEMRYQGREGFY